jgi:hypothetical protein
MATYIEVTSDVNHIYIEFNALETHDDVQLKDWSMVRGFMTDIQHQVDDSLTLRMVNGKEFNVCCLNSVIPGCLVVEVVNTSEPANNEELHTLLNDLL